MSTSDEILSIVPVVLVAGAVKNLEKGCVKSCKEHTRKLEVKPHSFKKQFVPLKLQIIELQKSRIIERYINPLLLSIL